MKLNDPCRETSLIATCPSGVKNSTPLQIGAEDVERVHKFTYLRSVVLESGGTEEDFAHRQGPSNHRTIAARDTDTEIDM